MNNYVLNCKSHFLAMFHGCAPPDERAREGRRRRALVSTGQISRWHWKAGLSLLGKKKESNR